MTRRVCAFVSDGTPGQGDHHSTDIVGHTDEGERVTVEIALLPLQHDTMTTVQHETISTDGGLRLSIMGSVYEPRRRNASSGGQCAGELLRITKPHGAWTLDEIRKLHDIWQRWHLNDMRAGCAHQTRIVHESTQYGQRIDLDGTTAANDCPVGYRYGSAWLYEPLPDEIVQQVRAWQTRLGS